MSNHRQQGINYNPEAVGLNKAEGERMRKVTDEQARAKRNVDVERRAMQRRRGCNCSDDEFRTDCPIHHGDDQ